MYKTFYSTSQKPKNDLHTVTLRSFSFKNLQNNSNKPKRPSSSSYYQQQQQIQQSLQNKYNSSNNQFVESKTFFNYSRNSNNTKSSLNQQESNLQKENYELFVQTVAPSTKPVKISHPQHQTDNSVRNQETQGLQTVQQQQLPLNRGHSPVHQRAFDKMKRTKNNPIIVQALNRKQQDIENQIKENLSKVGLIQVHSLRPSNQNTSRTVQGVRPNTAKNKPTSQFTANQAAINNQTLQQSNASLISSGNFLQNRFNDETNELIYYQQELDLYRSGNKQAFKNIKKNENHKTKVFVPKSPPMMSLNSLDKSQISEQSPIKPTLNNRKLNELLKVNSSSNLPKPFIAQRQIANLNESLNRSSNKSDKFSSSHLQQSPNSKKNAKGSNNSTNKRALSASSSKVWKTTTKPSERNSSMTKPVKSISWAKKMARFKKTAATKYKHEDDILLQDSGQKQRQDSDNEQDINARYITGYQQEWTNHINKIAIPAHLSQKGSLLSPHLIQKQNFISNNNPSQYKLSNALHPKLPPKSAKKMAAQGIMSSQKGRQQQKLQKQQFKSDFAKEMKCLLSNDGVKIINREVNSQQQQLQNSKQMIDHLNNIKNSSTIIKKVEGLMRPVKSRPSSSYVHKSSGGRLLMATSSKNFMNSQVGLTSNDIKEKREAKSQELQGLLQSFISSYPDRSSNASYQVKNAQSRKKELILKMDRAQKSFQSARQATQALSNRAREVNFKNEQDSENFNKENVQRLKGMKDFKEPSIKAMNNIHNLPQEQTQKRRLFVNIQGAKNQQDREGRTLRDNDLCEETYYEDFRAQSHQNSRYLIDRQKYDNNQL